MHKLIINKTELDLIGQEDYQVDNLLFLEFTTELGLEEVNDLFSNTNNLLEILVRLDEAERIYKNFCVYKQLQYSMGEDPIYRITLEQNDHLADALTQITELQMALVEIYEMTGGK
ncbi:MAG: hypothetical protein ACLRVU_01305 [Beduini sp.]|uniref:hypothetical protein n=1 Tax=Beduini sp. TaxID=1922300 RepID=UPI0039A39D61